MPNRTEAPQNPSTAELIEAAITAREHAYAPYSNYLVGAALETDTGEIFTGCNVENQGLSGTICAVRAGQAASTPLKEFAVWNSGARAAEASTAAGRARARRPA